MSALDAQANPAVKVLQESDEEQLYEELGIRLRAMEAEPGLAGNFQPAVTYEGTAMGPLDEVRDLGRRIFSRWEKEAYGLVCGDQAADEKDRDKVLGAFGVEDASTAVAAAIAAAMVSTFGLAPAIAAVIAALVVKRVMAPTAEEFCRWWGERLD